MDEEWWGGNQEVRLGLQHLPGVRGQVVKAGLDVLVVVVTLLLIEHGFCVEALQCGLQSQHLCLPPLPVSALVADVLQAG